MMKRMGGVGLALLLTAGLTACSGKSGEVLAEVNGEKITQGDLDLLGKINPRLQQQVSNPAGRDRIVANLVEQDLFYQDALKQGINRDPLVKAKVELYRQVIVAQALIDKKVEEAAKKYYDEHQSEFTRYGIAQIQINYFSPDQIKKMPAKERSKARTEEQALSLATQLLERLNKGEDFGKLAAEFSDDPASSKQGGSMGKVAVADRRIEARGLSPLLEKTSTMQVGEVVGPIKTAKGYHLVVLTEGAELQPFDQVQALIEGKIRNEVRTNLLADLKKNAKISYPQQEKEKKAAETAAAAANPEAATGEAAPHTAPASTTENAAPTPETK